MNAVIQVIQSNSGYVEQFTIMTLLINHNQRDPDSITLNAKAHQKS
jgi:hypothetical protein